MLEKSEGAIRLVTFNIRHGAPYDSYKGDPNAVAEACALFDADILALQEVDFGVRRSQKAHLGEIAAKACGMELIFAPTMPFHGGQYGNALLVRGHIEWHDIVPLPHGYRFGLKKEPRNAIMARVHVKDRTIDVAATHLSTQRWVSRKQLPIIMDSLSDEPFPKIVMGDLNRTYRKVLPFMGEVKLVQNSEPSFPVSSPRKLIDHVAVSGLNVIQSQVIQTEISDHLARTVDVI
jgi:endonuclease/exonuclease/phosphatase family metal-dependent hydrolase